MKSDKLEQTIKHYLINNLLKIEQVKENDKYLNPELRLWKNKKLTLSSSAINTLPYSKEEEFKQKDALFFIEANQIVQSNQTNQNVEKDVQIFKIRKSEKGIHRTPLCDIECKMVHFLYHAKNKTATKLFQKIVNFKFEKEKMEKIDFSKYIAFFINKNTQQKSNYFVFCFSDSLSSHRIKALNPNRELDPTKTSYISRDEFEKNKILCPEITFTDIQEMYQKHKLDPDFFDEEEREIIKKIISTGNQYFEKTFKDEFPFTSTNGKTLCFYPQKKTHKLANGHYRNPKTEDFEGGKIVSNYPFVSDIYKNYLKNVVIEYTKKNYNRLLSEAKELSQKESKKILAQENQLEEEMKEKIAI